MANIKMNDKGRPELCHGISLLDFQSYYWLKEELVSFCREKGLPASGSKTEIALRISHYISTGEIINVPKSVKPKRLDIPDELNLETVIEPGFGCSQKLRTFFEKEIGKSFHFNGLMRNFINNDGIGKTLGDAVNLWFENKANPPKEKEIGKQFEYNLHIREYFNSHENATLKEAIEAWYNKKDKRQPDI